jgi:hypothetical protein
MPEPRSLKVITGPGIDPIRRPREPGARAQVWSAGWRVGPAISSGPASLSCYKQLAP